jgi:hypothetical protein
MRSEHIYHEGACRPGFVCPQDCRAFKAEEHVGLNQASPQFDGDTYSAEFDYARLGKQMRAVADLMLDHNWRTLGEIAAMTTFPEASISARLRDLRKPKFGGHTVERRPRGPRENGLYEYRLLARDAQAAF